MAAPMVRAGSCLGTETHTDCIRVRRASLVLSPAQPTERTLPFPPLQTFTYRQCSGRSGRWAARGRRQRYQGICRECGRLPPKPPALPRCGGSLHYVRGLSLVLSFEKKQAPERSWRQVASWPATPEKFSRNFDLPSSNRHFDRSTALASRVGINQARAKLKQGGRATSIPTNFHLFELQ